LIGATVLFTTDSVFAGKKKYEKSQAVAQANSCDNSKLPENVFCQNLFSQIRGDGNAVNIIGVQWQKSPRSSILLFLFQNSIAKCILT